MLAVAVAFAATGAFLSVVLKRISHIGLCVLISFAAGALLAVALAHILPEAVRDIGWLPSAVSFASGYLLFYLISRFVSHVCPACSATHAEAHFRELTWSMVAVLSLHSFMDGLAILGGSEVGSELGLLVLAAVAYHKFPEGMALALIARGAGMGRAKAFGFALAVEALSTFAGGAAGLVLSPSVGSVWWNYALAHVSGGFVFIVGHALLSEVVKHHPRSTIVAALLGAAAMVMTGMFFASAHLH